MTLLTISVISFSLTGCEDANGRDIFLKSPEQGQTPTPTVNLKDETRESLEKTIQTSSPIIVGGAVIPGEKEDSPIGVNIQVNVDTLTAEEIQSILEAISANISDKTSQVNLVFYSANTANMVNITEPMTSLGLSADKIVNDGMTAELNKEFLAKFLPHTASK